MLLQAKCKYVINIIGRNHLKLDIKGVCMKQKIKTYFKGLFEYLKELHWFKKLLLIFFMLLCICELIYSGGAFLGLTFDGLSPIKDIFHLDVSDFLLDYWMYYSAFISSTYFLITLFSKKFNNFNCFIVALLLSLHPIVMFFIAWFPMIVNGV